MAEEDDGAKESAASDHGAKAPEPPATPTEPSTSSHTPATAAPRSEWTASDARGPLIAADGTRSEAPDAPADPAQEQIHEAPAAAHNVGPTSPATATDPPARPSSVVPAGIGAVAGAIVGAVVALWLYAGTNSGETPAVAALRAKVAALEARPAVPTDVSALDQRVATLEKKESARPTPTNAPAFDPGPLEQRITALGSHVDALQAQSADTKSLDAKVGGLSTTVAGLQTQTASNDKALLAIQDQQKSIAGKVGTPALAVVSASLVQAVADGQPYTMQVDALSSLGADPVKLGILKQNAQTGVASPKTLATTFAPLREPILATEHKAPPNASFMERMSSGMASLVSIRRADDVGGSDLASRVARIEADLAHDDLADALKTWDALPADAKAKSQTWATQLKASAATLGIARDLQNEAIAAMGGKKS